MVPTHAVNAPARPDASEELPAALPDVCFEIADATSDDVAESNDELRDASPVEPAIAKDLRLITSVRGGINSRRNNLGEGCLLVLLQCVLRHTAQLTNIGPHWLEIVCNQVGSCHEFS